MRVNAVLDKVIEERCSAAGCKQEEAPAGPMGTPRHVKHGSAFGRSVAVWANADDAVKVRVAPLKDLASTPASVVFDGAVRDGAAGAHMLKDLRLFTRDGFALLLLELSTGTYGFRVDAAGKVTPLKLD